jgi:hypothetical protein
MKIFNSIVFASLLLVTAQSPRAEINDIGIINGDVSQRICDTMLIGRDGSYKLRIPELDKKLLIKDQDIQPGVTAHAMIAAPDAGILFIVSTRISARFSKDSSVLDRVEPRTRNFAAQSGIAFADKRGANRFGRTYEFQMLNVQSLNHPISEGLDSLVYPIMIGKRNVATPGAIESLAVHRYFVAEAYMFEFAVILHTGSKLAGRNEEQLLELANDWLDQAVENFTPGRFEACAKK